MYKDIKQKFCNGNKKKCWNQFFWGMVLGDGYINPRGVCTIEHSTKQKEYLFWKYNRCKSLGICTEKMEPKVVQRQHKKTGRFSESYRFNTKTLFQKERDIFYTKISGSNRKRIPEHFEHMIGAEAIALWFMDDGGAGGNSRYGCVLDLSNYTPAERKRVQDMFWNLYRIETSLQGKKKSVKLFFKRKTIEKFYRLIEPFLHPSMKKKVLHIWPLLVRDNVETRINPVTTLYKGIG